MEEQTTTTRYEEVVEGKWGCMRVAFVTNMLTSKRPSFIPFWAWLYFNTLLNFIVTTPARWQLEGEGYQVIYPGQYQRQLRLHDEFYEEDEFLKLWQTLIKSDNTKVVLAGWRAKESMGARGELEMARRYDKPVVSWRKAWTGRVVGV
jgi:hypothetical protein